jgi:hypothetical protein
VTLDDSSLRWLVWRDHAYQSFVPPAIGASVTLPAEPFAFGELMEHR